MNYQRELFDHVPTCAHGVAHGPSCDPCGICQAWIQGQIAVFEAEVAAGIRDDRGFTPAERQAQARKRQEQAKVAA